MGGDPYGNESWADKVVMGAAVGEAPDEHAPNGGYAQNVMGVQV